MSSANALLERMRKLREERERAAAAAANNNSNNKTTSSAAATATHHTTAAVPSTTTTATTTGGSTAAAVAAAARTAMTSSSATADTTATTSSSSSSSSLPPPSFTSPASAVLCYRDSLRDPLCVPFTPATFASLLSRRLAQTQKRPRLAVSSSDDEAEDGGNKAGDDTQQQQQQQQQQQMTTSRATPDATAPAVCGDELLVEYLEQRLAATAAAAEGLNGEGDNNSCSSGTAHAAQADNNDGSSRGGDTDSLAGATGGDADATLYTDVAYATALRRARVDVGGAVRPMCRDVNRYCRKDRLAHGVYGVVFSATRTIRGKRVRSERDDGDDDDDDKKKDTRCGGGGNNTSRDTTTATSARTTTRTRMYALKHIKKQWLRESQVGFPPYLLREFDLLLRLRHPNVVAAKELVVLDPLPLPGTTAADDDENKDDDEKDDGEKDMGGSNSNSNNNSSTLLSSRTATASRVKDVFLVMEYCHFDLHSYMFRYTRDTRVPYLHYSPRSNAHPRAPASLLARIKCILLQLLHGLAFLHDHHILHRDLKASNVLLDARGRLKMADFGLARFYREGQLLTPSVVTLMYRAPELHLGVCDYTHAMDVWSAACIAAELFLKQPLFAAKTEAAHLLAVCDVLGVPSEETFAGLYTLPAAREAMRALPRYNRTHKLRDVFARSACSDAALLLSSRSGMDLLTRMLQWCPASRLSAAAATQHAFFREPPLPCAPAELMTPMPFAPVATTPSRTTATATTAAAAAAKGVNVATATRAVADATSAAVAAATLPCNETQSAAADDNDATAATTTMAAATVLADVADARDALSPAMTRARGRVVTTAATAATDAATNAAAAGAVVASDASALHAAVARRSRVDGRHGDGSGSGSSSRVARNDNDDEDEDVHLANDADDGGGDGGGSTRVMRTHGDKTDDDDDSADDESATEAQRAVILFGNETPFHLRPLPYRGVRACDAEARQHPPHYHHPLEPSSDSVGYISEAHRLHPLLTADEELRHERDVARHRVAAAQQHRRAREAAREAALQHAREVAEARACAAAAARVGLDRTNVGSDGRDVVTHQCHTVEAAEQRAYADARARYSYYARARALDRRQHPTRYNILTWEPLPDIAVPPRPSPPPPSSCAADETTAP